MTAIQDPEIPWAWHPEHLTPFKDTILGHVIGITGTIDGKVLFRHAVAERTGDIDSPWAFSGNPEALLELSPDLDAKTRDEAVYRWLQRVHEYEASQ